MTPPRGWGITSFRLLEARRSLSGGGCFGNCAQLWWNIDNTTGKLHLWLYTTSSDRQILEGSKQWGSRDLEDPMRSVKRSQIYAVWNVQSIALTSIFKPVYFTPIFHLYTSRQRHWPEHGRRSWGVAGDLTPLKICRRGHRPLQYVLTPPPKMSHFFIQNCCWITLQVSHHAGWKSCVKMEGKTMCLKQFDGLT